MELRETMRYDLKKKWQMYLVCTLSAFLQNMWMVFFSLSSIIFFLFSPPLSDYWNCSLSIIYCDCWCWRAIRAFIARNIFFCACVHVRFQFWCIEFHCSVWAVSIRAFMLLFYIRVSWYISKFNVHRKLLTAKTKKGRKKIFAVAPLSVQNPNHNCIASHHILNIPMIA